MKVFAKEQKNLLSTIMAKGHYYDSLPEEFGGARKKED
jgi:hypothetical protein